VLAVFVAIGGVSLWCFPDSMVGVSFPTPFRYWTIYSTYGMIVTGMLYLNRRYFNAVLMQLADREELVSSTLSSISDPLMVFDEHGAIVKMNMGATKLEKMLLHENSVPLLDAPCIHLDIKEPVLLRELLDFRSHEPAMLHLQMLLPEGNRWFNVSTSPRLVRQRYVGTVVYIQDVTNQQHLIQVQKMNALGALSSGIAHDFNNMLGAITNATTILMSDLGAEHNEMLEVIEEATQRSAELTSQLLLFSRNNPPDNKLINVHALIIKLVKLLRRTLNKKVEIITDFTAPSAMIYGDEGQLHSAFMNLGLNSAQAMLDGGKLTFRTSKRVLCDTECVLSPFVLEPGAYILIEVVDTGHGISPGIIRRIFEPFFTTKVQGQGTGLGLTAVYRMAEKHDGAVIVESEVDVGTSFTVYLPLSQKHPVAPTVSQNTDTACSGLRILVVDDEPLVRRSILRILSSSGYIPVGAESGDDAMSVLRDGQQFDLVILDMLMPKKSGREVFFEIKKFNPSLPVIISSGFTQAGVISELRSHGLSGMLHKPYSRTDLNEAIRQVFED
jgi:signal transduction histidine kinase